MLFSKSLEKLHFVTRLLKLAETLEEVTLDPSPKVGRVKCNKARKDLQQGTHNLYDTEGDIFFPTMCNVFAEGGVSNHW